MTLKEARRLQEGDLVAAMVESPEGGESNWSIEHRRWICQPVRAGQVVVFQRLIPKVRIVRNGPWNDGHDLMLLCRTLGGERAWLNIGNATRTERNTSTCRATVCGEEATA
jgi:hypothetical protein